MADLVALSPPGMGEDHNSRAHALVVHIQTLVGESPSSALVQTMGPSEVLPSNTAEAAVEIAPTPDDDSVTPMPSSTDDSIIVTPEPPAESIDASPITVGDTSGQEDNAVVSLTANPQPSSMVQPAGPQPLPDPQASQTPSPPPSVAGPTMQTPNTTGPAPVAEASAGLAQTPSVRPTTSAAPIKQTPSKVPLAADGNISGSTTDPSSSTIDGARSGGGRVGLIVGSVVGIVGLVCVVSAVVFVTSRSQYLPFLAAISRSGDSREFVVPERTIPDREGGSPNSENTPWRYEARSLDEDRDSS